MTHYSATPRFRLWTAPVSGKILLTCFLLTALAGIGFSVWQFILQTGFGREGPRGVVEHYQGNEDDPSAADRPIKMRMSDQELAEITHAHAFMMPMMLFILCHLFALTRWSQGAKSAVYVLAFVSSVALLASPWLIRKYGDGFLIPAAASGILTLGSWALLSLVPIYEIWCVKGSAQDPPGTRFTWAGERE